MLSTDFSSRDEFTKVWHEAATALPPSAKTFMKYRRSRDNIYTEMKLALLNFDSVEAMAELKLGRPFLDQNTPPEPIRWCRKRESNSEPSSILSHSAIEGGTGVDLLFPSRHYADDASSTTSLPNTYSTIDSPSLASLTPTPIVSALSVHISQQLQPSARSHETPNLLDHQHSAHKAPQSSDDWPVEVGPSCL